METDLVVGSIVCTIYGIYTLVVNNKKMKKQLKDKFLETYKNHVIDGVELKYSETASRMCEFWFEEIETYLEGILDMTECPYERGKIKEQLAQFK